MSRADKITSSRKKVEYYSDFLTNFDKHPITGSLARVTNEQAVKLSIKNLVFTAFMERPFQPNLYSSVPTLLFDMDDEFTKNLLEKTIRSVISNHEPRAHLTDLVINMLPDSNDVKVTIYFQTVNTIEPVQLDVLITKVR